MSNRTPVNNQRPDRGRNRKAGNVKLSAEEERAKLAKELRIRPKTKALVELLEQQPHLSQSEAYRILHPKASIKTSQVQSSKILNKDSVQIYSNAVVRKAKLRIGSLVDSGNENIALKASEAILDRQLGKAVQRNENTSTTVRVALDLTGARLGAHFVRPDVIDAEATKPTVAQ